METKVVDVQILAFCLVEMDLKGLCISTEKLSYNQIAQVGIHKSENVSLNLCKKSIDISSDTAFCVIASISFLYHWSFHFTFGRLCTVSNLSYFCELPLAPGLVIFTPQLHFASIHLHPSASNGLTVNNAILMYDPKNMLFKLICECWKLYSSNGL